MEERAYIWLLEKHWERAGVLPSLLRARGRLALTSILFLKEATQTEVSSLLQENDKWTMTLYKHDHEWRGHGILVSASLRALRNVQGDANMLAAVFEEDVGDKIWLMSLHLPAKATVEETDHSDETFDLNNGLIGSRTARGETLLRWFQQMTDPNLPDQKGETPSYYPYSPDQRPRRLDYILHRRIRPLGEGTVLEKTRTMVGSDHEADVAQQARGLDLCGEIGTPDGDDPGRTPAYQPEDHPKCQNFRQVCREPLPQNPEKRQKTWQGACYEGQTAARHFEKIFARDAGREETRD